MSSSARTSITSPVPSARRAKKSGACRRLFAPAGQVSQNGCEEKATTSGEKSRTMTRSRSSQDSNPTRSRKVEDHHCPEKPRRPG